MTTRCNSKPALISYGTSKTSLAHFFQDFPSSLLFERRITCRFHLPFFAHHTVENTWRISGPPCPDVMALLTLTNIDNAFI